MTIPTEHLTDEERYRYEERLAILGVIGQPTPTQHWVAMGDIFRFRQEQRKENNESTTTKRH